MTIRSARRAALRSARRSARGLSSAATHNSARSEADDATGRITPVVCTDALRMAADEHTTSERYSRDHDAGADAHGADISPDAAAPRTYLKARGLGHVFADRQALHDVDLDLGGGELLVLLGPNGAGKSTLMRAISGQLRPQRGEVLLNGHSPADSVLARQSLGVVPQAIALFPKLSVRENLAAFGAVMGLTGAHLQRRLGEVLDIIDLRTRADDRVETLSGGMQRRVNIGAALIHQPRLLLLDEPTVGVDRDARLRLAGMLTRLREDGLAILLTTHDLEEAEMLADRVAIMVAGRIHACASVAVLVERVFGERREIAIELRSAAEASALLDALPADFAPREDNVISAMRRLAPGELDELLGRCRNLGAQVEEIRVRRPGLAHLLRHFIDAAAHDPASGRTAGPHQARTQVAASVDIAGPAPVTIDQRQLGPEPFAPDQPSPDPLGHDSAEQPRPRVFSVGGGRR